MAKTIQVRDEVYQALYARKEGTKSFSDIIWELLTADKNLDALSEISPPLPGYDYGEMDRRMREADINKMKFLAADRPPARKKRAGK